MSPNLMYWTAALAVLAIVVICAFLGWRSIRHRDLRRHRSLMNVCVILTLVFLLSYLVKVALIGKENLSLWSAGNILVLRVHEVFVAVMVLAGATARILATRFGGQTLSRLSEARGGRKDLGWHRRMGQTAVLVSCFALITAAVILFGMYSRTG